MTKKDKKKTKKKEEKKLSRRRKDYIDEAGPETYDIVDLKPDISPDAIGSSDVDEAAGDTTDQAGNTDIPADMRGHGVGTINAGEIQAEPDTAGGTTGGGGNEGAKIGYNGETDVGDADPNAGPDIDSDTDGTQAGQTGHQGVDEGTD